MPWARMKVRTIALAAAVVFAACGGDGGEPTETGATGGQGSSGAEGTEITAGDFLVELLPDKEAAIEAIAATEAECENLRVEPSLVLLISDAAADADPDRPLSELVLAEC